MKIILGGDVFCPCCGCAEVEDTTLPVLQWKWQIRPNKVENGGVWWSECLLCKVWFGSNGHFTIDSKTKLEVMERLGITEYGTYHFL